LPFFYGLVLLSAAISLLGKINGGGNTLHNAKPNELLKSVGVCC
jgi:hypothetical protein